jgi:hypothetical protein
LEVRFQAKKILRNTAVQASEAGAVSAMIQPRSVFSCS